MKPTTSDWTNPDRRKAGGTRTSVLPPRKYGGSWPSSPIPGKKPPPVSHHARQTETQARAPSAVLTVPEPVRKVLPEARARDDAPRGRVDVLPDGPVRGPERRGLRLRAAHEAPEREPLRGQLSVVQRERLRERDRVSAKPKRSQGQRGKGAPG
jgi:hypothetical protein